MKEFLMTGVKFLFFTPVAWISVAVLYFFYCEANKAYWDYRVKEMCLKDGGVKVFEKVDLTKEQYVNLKDFQGSIRAPNEKFARPDDVLVSSSSRAILHAGYPTVDRIETKIFLKSNMRVLGHEISYARIGGDMPTGISHPSTFSCGDLEGFIVNINKLIYSVKGK